MLTYAPYRGTIQIYQNRRCPDAAGHSSGRGNESWEDSMQSQATSSCRVCGNPLPRQRRLFCSRTCYAIGIWDASESKARFWSHVSKSDGCWVWNGARMPFGHGQVRVRGRTYLTHRYAWEIERGPIPQGLNVLHRCDNPPCVRLDHLFLGTHADNVYDRIKKGRSRYVGLAGEQNNHARLTTEQVRDIAAQIIAGDDHGAIAGRYGVTRAAIWLIANRRNWRHVTDGLLS